MKNLKHIKLYEDFSGNSSDEFIEEVLHGFKLPFTIGEDEVGNEGVYIIRQPDYKLEIYSTHPDEESSAYHIAYYPIGGKPEDFNTLDLEQSLQELLDLPY